MNAYDVLREHHSLLRQLGLSMRHAPVGSPQRQRCTEELLREFDIHMRIEDDIYYPAMAAASTLIAIAHAEHRQIYDQLAVALRTRPKSLTIKPNGTASYRSSKLTPMRKNAT